MKPLRPWWRLAGTAAVLSVAVSYGTSGAASAELQSDSLQFDAVGSAFAISQSFNPQDRSAPARTADGGTRRFTAVERGAPARTADGGSRRFTAVERGAPARTADGGSRTFAPGDRGAPARTADGGARGCLREVRPLDPGRAMPLTVSEHPTFYWYVPGNAAPQLRFVLRPASDESKTVYETYMETPSEDSIVSLTMPEAPEKALEVGETYHWYLVTVCNPSDPKDGIAIDGWIERIEPSENLASNIKASDAREHPNVYAAAGIWHEAIEGFVEQRQVRPEDATLTQQWQAFLESVNLEAYANLPVVSWQPVDE